MGRLIIRTAVYFVILCIFALLFNKVTGRIGLLLLGALVLALVNTLLRPLFTVLAFPVNMLTLGIASVFVNVLTIVISDAMVRGINIEGVWINILLAIVIMISDTLLRKRRKQRGMRRLYHA